MDEHTRLRLNLPYCDSCKERHYGGNCPPHEVRTTGIAWFDERVTDLEGELELAKAETQRFSDSANENEKQLVNIATFLGGDAGDVKIGEKTITGLVKQEIEQLRGKLGHLLAIIHRDGGHHTREVGEEQSVEDAHTIWADRGVEIDQLKEELEAERLWIKEGKKLHDVQKVEIEKEKQTRLYYQTIVYNVCCTLDVIRGKRLYVAHRKHRQLKCRKQ